MQNLSVIDSDSITFICGLRNSDSSHSQMMGQVSQFVENILAVTQATHYLGFLGGEGNFRKQVATTKAYKGNRGPKPESVQYWAPQIEAFLVDHWGFVQCHGIEADDACSIAHKLYSTEYELTVAAVDHDLLQIPTTHYNYSKGKITLVTPRGASYIFHHQLLTGCTGDEVPGLPNWGPVKASKLLDPIQELFYETDEEYHELCRRKVTDAYFKALGEPWMDYYQEQYTLLRLLDCGEKYGFTCPSPVPVPIPSLVTVEEDISHLFV